MRRQGASRPVSVFSLSFSFLFPLLKSGFKCTMHPTTHPPASALYQMVWESAIGKLDGFGHHARNVERPLEEIALRRLRNRSIAVEISVPLAVFLVGHALIRPFAHLFVPI